MKILFRYIFREFLIPLAYCLIGFIGIYVLFELFGSFSRLSASSLGFGEIVGYFAGYLSPFFHYLAPAALMLATLYTMWNFCRHSEITAMRASGISLLTIVKPLIVVSVLLAAFVAWVNECHVPGNAMWAKLLRNERFDVAKARRQGAPDFKDTKRKHSWTVLGEHSPDCSHFGDVRIAIRNDADKTERVITAKAADWMDGEWWLTEPDVIHYKENVENLAFAPQVSPTPQLDSLKLRVMPELRERPEDIMMQTAGAQWTSSRGKFRFLRKGSDLTDQTRRDLMYDACAQILSPLACIIITLLSIPAGISSGRQSVFAGVLGAIGLFFAYYGLTIACMVLAKTNLMPPIPAAVIPPVVFASIAVYYCFRPLKLTMILTVVLIALVGIEVLLSCAATRLISADETYAHAIASVPVVITAACFLWRLRPPARLELGKSE